MVEFNDRRPPSARRAKPAAQAAPPLYHGTMHTERFSFDAYGHSEAEVHQALNEGFKHHLRQYGTSIGEWRQGTGAKTPTEHYEPSVHQVRPGAAYRDGEELGPKKRSR